MMEITQAQGSSVTIGIMKYRMVSEVRVALVAALFCCLLPLIPRFMVCEAATEDLRFILRGDRKTAARIVIAPISDQALNHWEFEPLSLWGGHLAQALEGVKKAKAIAVGVDYIPAVDADQYLANVSEEVFRLDGREKEFTDFEAKITDSPILQPNTALIKFLLTNPDFVVLSDNDKLIAPLRGTGAPLARVDVTEQADGNVRTMLHERDGIPYFASALTKLKNQQLDMVGSYGINYVSLNPSVAFETVPFEHLNAPNDEEKGKLSGAIVLVGATYSGANDEHQGVLGKSFAGVELHAHALSSLLDHVALQRGSHISELGWTALLAAIGLGLLQERFRFAWGMLGHIMLLTAYIVLAQWTFTTRYFWLPLAAPSLALLLPFVAFHLARALTERKNRQLVERVFGQYLSPSVRDYLLASPENRALGGQHADATVLFFDLRGSTAFAEGRDPGEVLTELNHLFSQVVPVFQRHNGTVLRYSGDGFLAVFGAPTPDPAHALHAVAASKEVTQVLERWNANRIGRGEFVWQFGMGLHSGSLIWGSLGSSERPELTLIGDTVNVAARLQDATKTLGAVTVLSEITWKQALCPAAEGSCTWEIRGRREPLIVYYFTE